jgi:Protein of unknown function (DUF2842)
MKGSERKLVGILLMIIFVFVYAMTVMGLFAPVFLGGGRTAQLVFYAVAGVAWVPPLMLLIKWMGGGDDDTPPSGEV